MMKFFLQRRGVVGAKVLLYNTKTNKSAFFTISIYIANILHHHKDENILYIHIENGFQH